MPAPGAEADRFAWVEVSSAAQLRAWLEAHHAQHEAVWLVTYRKAAGDRYLSTDQVLDELVAFGWIDGIRRRIDEVRTRQLVSPRRTQPWAKSYKDRAARLVEAGAMHPAGQASVERARAGGGWEAMAQVDALVVPQDLAAALADRPPAAERYAAFPPSTRRNVLRWIAGARTEATRTRRIAVVATDAARNVRTKTNG